MEQNNRQPRQYSGTRGLSLAIVIGAAIGTVIGKLMDNMNTGLMIGLVIRIPFIRLNHFMEKRMEDTKMM